MSKGWRSITTGAVLFTASLIPITQAAGLNDPTPVPAVAFPDLTGTPVSLLDFKGKVLLVNFWGTWCVPCLQEIPELVALSHRHEKKGLVVVGIAVDSGRPEEVCAFAAAKGMDYPILLGEVGVAKRVFQVVGFPTSLLVDRNGIIRKRYVGPQTAEVLRHDVEPLLRKKHQRKH